MLSLVGLTNVVILVVKKEELLVSHNHFDI